MTESTVWRVMHPDGSRTVVGHYPLALAYAKGDRSRIDEITLELRPGPLTRELKVMRGMASSGGDDESIQQAEIDLHRLQHIESASLLALGMLWMTERHSPNAQAAFQTLRNALPDTLSIGSNVLFARPAVTNARQRADVTVECTPTYRLGKAGGAPLCITTRSGGRTIVEVNAPAKVTVTITAPAKGGYGPLELTKTYKVRFSG